jgi:flavin-dependent dehydrogenase
MNLRDVIVIGGGPSGSTSASLLASKGYNVLLLEKEKFPREHIGESLIPASYDILSKLGVLEALKKISPRKPGVNFISNDGKTQSMWCFKNAVKNESYLSFHVKRSAFDELLLNNSREKGVTVLEQHAVKHVNLEREDEIVEVTATDASGETKTFFAKFLIDASGQHTFLGSRIGMKTPVKDLDRVAVWSHWSGAHYDIALKEGAIKIVYLGGSEKKGWIWVIPLSSDNLSIGAVINNSFLKKEKERILAMGIEDWKHEFYMNEINSSEAVKKLLPNATLDHKVQVNGDYSYFCKKKYGKNYALVGDAGAFLDPIFSSGIFVGMQSAELVSNAVHEKLSAGNDQIIDAVYENINGALGLIEKFIKLFYNRELIDFSKMGNPEEQLKVNVQESIYAIFHYLLAGDFFQNYRKYSDFIDTMANPLMQKKFQNLINHTRKYGEEASCGETYEEMYGHVTLDVKFDLTAFSS